MTMINQNIDDTTQPHTIPRQAASGSSGGWLDIGLGVLGLEIQAFDDNPQRSEGSALRPPRHRLTGAPMDGCGPSAGVELAVDGLYWLAIRFVAHRIAIAHTRSPALIWPCVFHRPVPFEPVPPRTSSTNRVPISLNRECQRLLVYPHTSSNRIPIRAQPLPRPIPL